LPHGAAHLRAAKALRAALLETQPGLTVEVVNALSHCAPWFRAYYNSYEIPLRLWPRFWGWVESIQHQAQSTTPHWLYRRGAPPLFRFLREAKPDVVVATEVGMCELACLHKRTLPAAFRLAALELMDFNQAWVQPEVDLFLCTHPDLAAELVAAGAPAPKVVTTGQPIDPVFCRLPERQQARARLRLAGDQPVLLSLFGGSGFGNPGSTLAELHKLRQPPQVVVIAGRNARMKREARALCRNIPHAKVLGWVDDMHVWMVAADLMVSKPGGGTLNEGFACGLPMLALDPLPGNEERICRWIEQWGCGVWVRNPGDLVPTLERLMACPQDLARLRARAASLARPRAAYAAAAEILKLGAV
jgi:processive 1,2-diacylglycerol beta-glucosyltransferase